MCTGRNAHQQCEWKREREAATRMDKRSLPRKAGKTAEVCLPLVGKEEKGNWNNAGLEDFP